MPRALTAAIAAAGRTPSVKLNADAPLASAASSWAGKASVGVAGSAGAGSPSSAKYGATRSSAARASAGAAGAGAGGNRGGRCRYEQIDAERPPRQAAHRARGRVDLVGRRVRRADEAERARLADRRDERRRVAAAGERRLDDRVLDPEPAGECGMDRHRGLVADARLTLA
jgi:hypothetical protein